jgi:hypothetical protein
MPRFLHNLQHLGSKIKKPPMAQWFNPGRGFLTEWKVFVTDAMSCFYAFCFVLRFSRNSDKCCVQELGQGVLLWSGDMGVVVILMRVDSTHERESGGRVILRDRTTSTAAKD